MKTADLSISNPFIRKLQMSTNAESPSNSKERCIEPSSSQSRLNSPYRSKKSPENNNQK